ncbi:hypothetical protein JCM15519_02520 [Fundidesulfovibrio butyratiphilus]
MFEASGELLLILVVALIVVGPSRLPELIRSFGKGLAEFRRMTSDVKATLEREIERADELKRIGEIKKELFDEADKAKQVLTGVAQDVGGQINEVAREAGVARPESLGAAEEGASSETDSAPDSACADQPQPPQDRTTSENAAREPVSPTGEAVSDVSETPAPVREVAKESPDASPAPKEEKSHA